MKVGGDETLVDPHGGAGLGGAQAAMLVELAGVVIEYFVIRGVFGADDVADLGVGGGAVQSGGDQNGDVFAGDAASLETLEQGREDDWIGRGAGDVADRDGGGFFAGDHIRERAAGGGGVECGFNGGGRVGQGRGGFPGEDLALITVRYSDREAFFSEGECGFHSLSLPPATELAGTRWRFC